MIKLALRVLAVMAAAAIIFLLIGALLPHHYDVRTEILIVAPPEKVFPLINRLDQWPQWSQWKTDEQSPLQIEYGAVIEGIGAVQTWREPRGTGKLWITESQPLTTVAYSVEFSGFPRMDSEFKLESGNGSTLVKWASRGRLPAGPFHGWLRFVFVRGLKTQYDAGLNRLKEVVEAPPGSALQNQ